MTLLTAFPLVETCFVSRLSTLTSARVGYKVPRELEDVLPFIAVRRLGGTDDLQSDHPTVDVLVFGKTLKLAKTLAAEVQQLVLNGGSYWRAPSGLVDRVTTEVGPHVVPYDNPDVEQVVATYRATLRRAG